ncbi:hypothetical protein EJ06DRAFT_554876 [Trichodelitschia bisporula]|uniref:Inheritance of peroxisomes protein 1 n=1 Tax=Trichodelitschia bisporula TaxID=703511 RepID=A0A6G1I1M5_9PEZI|nr:hypothetical protein EJ06DRAFT_554876 [Trichodelitschia bisporula]
MADQHQASAEQSTCDVGSRFLHPGTRRVHTLPTKLIAPASEQASSAAGSVETLFASSVAKVVSFSVPAAARRPASAGAGDVDGTLPWAYPTERTLASGPLRVYRVPSSGVSFLNSGPLLHPILPRSQCWCVDEDAKFVLRVREGSFYRIELPVGGPEHGERVEDFKNVLSIILQYEKTPSPFRRGFVTPTAPPPQTLVRQSTKPQQRAKRWKLNRVWEPEEAEQRRLAREESDEDSTPTTAYHETPGEGSVADDEETNSASEAGDPPQRVVVSPSGSPQMARLSLRPRLLQLNRSVTMPVRQPIKPLLSMSPTIQEETGEEPDTLSLVSSRDSFHSFDDATNNEDQAFHSAVHTPGNDIVEQFAAVRRRGHRRDGSDATIIRTPRPGHSPRPHRLPDDTHSGSDPSTPTLISDSDGDSVPDLALDVFTPPPSESLRLRRLPTGNRQNSFERSAAATNSLAIFAPKAPPSRQKQLGAALVQKTYSLLIGPPAHLVAMMLQIAARIVRGVPDVYGFARAAGTNRRRRIPCEWESSADEDAWDEEDDFGIPLHKASSKE